MKLSQVEAHMDIFKDSLGAKKKKTKKYKTQIKRSSEDLSTADSRSSSSDKPPLSYDDVANLGLCRRLLLDTAWHHRWPNTYRSLLNFGSLDEFLVYISIFFPGLRPNIKLL